MASGNSSNASNADSVDSTNSVPRGTVSTCQSNARVRSAASQARMKPRPRASMLECMVSTGAEQVYTICLCPRLIRCCAAVNIPFSSSMLIDASKPSVVGVLMPMIGTWVRLSCPISSASTANEATNTASTLRRTGSVVKKSRRFSAVSMCW